MSKQAEEGLVFEALRAIGSAKAVLAIQRARVPGGWLVAGYLMGLPFKNASVTFYPDPEHTWDGNSLPNDTAEVREVEESHNHFFERDRRR